MPIIGETYPLQTIYFYLIQGCNLQCRHCWISPPYQTEAQAGSYLPLDIFSQVVKEAENLGLQGVKLTGGEPFLHPELSEILTFIRDRQLKLGIETNGVLCTDDLAMKISDCFEPAVSVSLDGATQETHEMIRGVRGCFNDALNGIRSLVNHGIKPQIIMSLLPENRGEIEDMVELAGGLDAGSVKFNIVQPISRGEVIHKRQDAISITELLEIGDWIENVLAKESPIPIYHSHPPAFKSLSSLYGEEKLFRQGCHVKGIIGVLADGSFSLCGIGSTISDLVFGNARQDSVESIWSTNEVLLEIRRSLPERLEGICGKCLMKHACLGSCIAMNYHQSSSLYSSHWYCKAADEIDRFPNTRTIELLNII